jgi:hypothetical protein
VDSPASRQFHRFKCRALGLSRRKDPRCQSRSPAISSPPRSQNRQEFSIPGALASSSASCRPRKARPAVARSSCSSIGTSKQASKSMSKLASTTRTAVELAREGTRPQWPGWPWPQRCLAHQDQLSIRRDTGGARHRGIHIPAPPIPWCDEAASPDAGLVGSGDLFDGIIGVAISDER